jgi:hypothetical protein
MGRPYLCDRMAATDDGDRLATFDGIQQIREVAGCLGRGHGLHIPTISDNQILREGQIFPAELKRPLTRIGSVQDIPRPLMTRRYRMPS